jgi:hypothetical protein
VLGRALNNYSLVTWGSSDRVERRLAASDEALALAGRGLSARTEFFALLHRGPLRLHLGDVAGFEADLAAATRVGAALTGPEVQPHLAYQETGRAMVRGDWALAEHLGATANELYRSTSMWGAAACTSLHAFTFRRHDGRIGEALDQLVDAGDELGVPLLQALAVVAAAEAGDREEAGCRAVGRPPIRRTGRRTPTWSRSPIAPCCSTATSAPRTCGCCRTPGGSSSSARPRRTGARTTTCWRGWPRRAATRPPRRRTERRRHACGRPR